MSAVCVDAGNRVLSRHEVPFRAFDDLYRRVEALVPSLDRASKAVNVYRGHEHVACFHLKYEGGLALHFITHSLPKVVEEAYQAPVQKPVQAPAVPPAPVPVPAVQQDDEDVLPSLFD